MQIPSKLALPIGFIAFYCIGLTLFGWANYTTHFQTLLDHADQKLALAATASDRLLPAKLHSAPLVQHMSRAEEEAIAKTLTSFAQEMQLAYVYTLVQHQGKLRFTSSSAAPGEFESKQYKLIYWSEYDDASPQINKAIQTLKPTSAEYTDQWGSFRSYFLPRIAEDGTVYIVGADLDISAVHALAMESMQRAVANGVLLTILCLPFILIARRNFLANIALREQAYFKDPLTHLPNKNQLEKDLATCFHPHLVMLNIDRFYYVTSSYGQAFGNMLLCEFAYNLANYTHPSLKNMRVYHIHNDEFAVLVDQHFHNEQNLHVFNDFYNCVSQTQYRMPDGNMIALDLHIGVTAELDDPLELAQLALRKAQETNTSIIFYNSTESLPESYLSNIKKIQLIKDSFENNRVIAYFHPIVDARTGNIEKYEVLSRIVDDAGKVIMLPDEFVPLMQRSRNYGLLTLSMLQQAIDISRVEKVELSINFSTHDIIDPELANKIVKLVSQSGIAKQLHFELLETDSLVDEKSLSQFIMRLKRLGCRVGLDDLGKAYSNFDRLMSLPIDFVKIDRGVMARLEQDTDAQEITQKIVQFARTKKITTVAEYCYTPEVCRLAANLGIDYLQGHWLAEPEAHINRKVRAF
ncbi:EAL domain-containing protein [Saccharophagus degradans]|uniref:Diguanylate cyclase/phosphodiesterase n=1 Tax=Saccharophagus degradans (strain 2-40 / ATCC 43961 / DSM 17024) TaxID=203122 RepID=Q21FG1_SACD2|nr:GGDEF domain-containing protein [Saccharophagus degradans]ABD82568.1 diguanylate cyclase/phosphodiesterase [Saccharophagus degradans 2-40]